MQLAPTPRDTVFRDGTAQLYRFRRPESGSAGAGMPVLLVPSLINRWYVLDLRKGASLVESMVAAGIDAFCLDWGAPEDEDRYLSWEDVLSRLGRAVRAVKRQTGAEKVALVGYCMGATLAGIYTALHPEEIGALVNIAGPFDFSKGGFLAHLTDPRWFDATAIREAGNVSAPQMQSGFTLLRPTQTLSKLVGLMDRGTDPKFREGFEALESWASDNVAFPAAAYETYIKDLYQQNLLVAAQHHVAGKKVDLGNIRCPVLTIVADRDAICPPPAAVALNEKAGSKDREVKSVPGGHVGAVVGSKASAVLYPHINAWLKRTTWN